jgi:molecular chaperone GrpE (heat shock protein)
MSDFRETTKRGTRAADELARTTRRRGRRKAPESGSPSDEVRPVLDRPERGQERAGQHSSEGGLAAGSIQELADDLLLLLRMVRGLSDAQTEMRAQVESALSRLQQIQRQQAAELYNLRRDLLNERRAQANRSAFDAVHPVIDHIGLIQASMSDCDSSVARHMSALLSALRMLLRGLGFAPFSVDVGAPFDPARMECVEYAKGEQGVVLAVLRPGYQADGVVVRPCGVAIADPAAASPDLASEPPTEPAEREAESVLAQHETDRIEIEDEE